jgi:hypothetical protein
VFTIVPCPFLGYVRKEVTSYEWIIAKEARKQASNGKFIVEEELEFACGDITCDYKTLFIYNIWSV